MTSASVIIPTHNRPVLLRRAVSSALAALPDDGEIIVVDDASREPASVALADLEDGRVTVLRRDAGSGGGGSPSRNMGVASSSGLVLFFLDDDDEMLPHHIRHTLTTAVSKGAEHGFTARRFAETDAAGNVIFEDEKRGLAGGPTSADDPYKERTFPFSAGFWLTRAAFDRVGPMAETMSTNSDTEYACRLWSADLKGWFEPEPGVIIYDRMHEKGREERQVTKRTKADARAAAFADIAARHRGYLARDAGASEFVHSRWIKHALRADDIVSAKAGLASVSQTRLKAKLSAAFAIWALAGKKG